MPLLAYFDVISRRVALVLALSLTAAAACSTRPAAKAQPQAAGVADSSHIHAVLLNGGGRREINFQSHQHHLERLVGLLMAEGVQHQNIAVFSADGQDPAADLATREAPTSPDFWLLPASGAMRLLAPPTVYVDSHLPGFDVHPARKAELQEWFAKQGKRLGAGDTLLFYVTDHGEENKADLTNNTITLWNERLSVEELRQLLAQLDPSVRVVMLMSQCFSGSFSNAIGAPNEAPSGSVCGYFSSTADRYAYGCYAENRGKDGVGHSFQFFQALEPLGGFPEAHRRVLITDDTPDVPNTTTDYYLAQLLSRRATEKGLTFSEYVDVLLAEAWQDRGAHEADLRLLDSIGHTFGSFSPRSMGELQEQATVLPEFSERLSTYSSRWEEALEALRIENLERFRAAHPEWSARLNPSELKKMSEAERQQLGDQLLAVYAPFVQQDGERTARLTALRSKAGEASAATYRAEVRLGVVLRMRAILTDIAGDVYMQQYATPAERETYGRLKACEDLQFASSMSAQAGQLEAPSAFPPLAEERQVLENVMPAWMGIQYRPVGETPRKRYEIEKGAVVISTVFPDSPASKAGLEVGDIVLGPPSAPFLEPHQVREWTMRSEIDKPERLLALRDGKKLEITLKPGPYPLELPKLPGPPKVGSEAPPLKLELFHGQTKLSAAKPRLLFFWATWCSICHSAVPELMAYGAAKGVEVVAITDEDPEVLKKHFAEWKEPFPSIVAIDPLRTTFQSYGVSGTPTFVLVDEKGIVRHYQTGYSLAKGLTIDGWKWEGAVKQANAH